MLSPLFSSDARRLVVLRHKATRSADVLTAWDLPTGALVWEVTTLECGSRPFLWRSTRTGGARSQLLGVLAAGVMGVLDACIGT